MPRASLTRREFLKLGGLGLGALAFSRLPRPTLSGLAQTAFPTAPRLGRAVEEMDKFINVRSEPSTLAPEAGTLPGDTVVEWLREVVGEAPGYRNQRWVETPHGYIWSPLLQPVKNITNTPLTSLPQYGEAPGMWMEVTQPYVEVQLANAAPLGFRIAYLVEHFMPIRFYYGQVMWVDEIRTTDAGVEYHVRELHGSRGDHFWAPAAAFKPIYPEDITPISPDVADKQILINIARQTLSCFENGQEVFFCRVATGRYDEETQTPVGDYLQVYMKYVSTHMEGGASGAGYDLSGIGWATFIATGGIAIHTCYWHNNYGERMSAGCVNATPEDAKFIYRWTGPEAPYYPGKIDQVAGTHVRVVES